MALDGRTPRLVVVDLVPVEGQGREAEEACRGPAEPSFRVCCFLWSEYVRLIMNWTPFSHLICVMLSVLAPLIHRASIDAKIREKDSSPPSCGTSSMVEGPLITESRSAFSAAGDAPAASGRKIQDLVVIMN